MFFSKECVLINVHFLTDVEMRPETKGWLEGHRMDRLEGGYPFLVRVS